ncbi:hypothetical protein NQ095_07280 [Rossellomorea sp. SC111]|uniref:hypothetical protein n=1 Tax=Rossellomorea sp. SC111 TaxID=2968985 RepID=UPI00215A2EC4|nr:hypothetical protein [Rossellomorea sp. SC111]MCR8848199.1 hypothetical protein [Rossellomorea sp. SC111]
MKGKMEKTHLVVNLIGSLLLFWGGFQAFYFIKYGHETEFAYYVNIAGPALLSLLLLSLAINKIAEKNVKMIFLYLSLSIAVAYVSSAFYL